LPRPKRLGVSREAGVVIKVADMGELMTAVEAIPLFPLPGTVFIPHTMLPLHVFEARYRDMVDDAMAGNATIAVPRLRPGWERGYEGRPPIFQTAGFGKIVHYDPLPDGRANIVILGLGRIRIRDEVDRDTLYRVAEGEVLVDGLGSDERPRIEAQVRRLKVMLAQIVGGRPQLAERVEPLMHQEMATVPFVNALAHLVLPDVDARQRFIEIERVAEQVETVEGLLAGAFAEAVAYA
jgi:Lon protease-like protein